MAIATCCSTLSAIIYVLVLVSLYNTVTYDQTRRNLLRKKQDATKKLTEHTPRSGANKVREKFSRTFPPKVGNSQRRLSSGRRMQSQTGSLKPRQFKVN